MLSFHQLQRPHGASSYRKTDLEWTGRWHQTN